MLEVLEENVTPTRGQRCVEWFGLPRKVVEMYSDTWFPERLISDKWDSSLFSILLN